MVTAGRRSELARIAELAGARHEGALLVVGPTGSGKTHLLEAAHEHDPDRTVLLRTNPSEVAWPLSGFSALFSSIDDSRAVEFGGRFVLRSTDPAHMFAAASDLLALLRGLDLKPVVVLIDDIDKMDAESRLLLGFMSSRLAGTHIRLVATATSIVEVDSLAGVPLCPLEPLSDDEAAMIALGLADVDEGTLQLVVAQSAGNALAIFENIRALTPAQRAGQEPLRMPLPPGQAGRAALAALRPELDPTRTTVLERLACAPVSLLGAASEGQPEWADAIEELHGMGLVAEHGPYVWIRNPLLRSALIGSVRSRRRRELHERLAIANADPASPLADWHLSWADPVAARDGGLLAGAIALADQGYPLAAAELADRAATGGFDSQLDALVELATVLLGRGELALAARYIRLALTERASPAPDLIRLAETRLWVEFFSSHHVAHLDPDAPLLHSVDDPDGVARVMLSAGAIHAMRGEFAASREAVERAAGLLDRSTPVTVALHADVAELLAASLGEPPRTSAPGGSAETVGRPLGDLAIRARGLTLRERYPQARRAFASAAGPVPGGTRAWTDWMTLLSADNELRAGRIGDAVETLREWKGSATNPLALAPAGPLLAWLDFADGRYDDADRALGEWAERTRGRASPLSAATTFALLGELSLVNGDPEQAMQQLSLADALAAPLENPSLVRHLPELVESLAAIGRFDEARAITTRFAAEARTHPTRWARLAYARAAAVSTPGEPSLELFERAIASFEPRDSRFELAKLRAAKALRLAGLGADAEHATSEARIEFEGIGARAWARRLDDAAPIMETPVAHAAASLELLTEEERTIALLVQQGLRNKEIAAQLFVSVRTVELRLTHIYRKVGARSRSHLVSLLS